MCCSQRVLLYVWFSHLYLIRPNQCTVHTTCSGHIWGLTPLYLISCMFCVCTCVRVCVCMRTRCVCVFKSVSMSPFSSPSAIFTPALRQEDHSPVLPSPSAPAPPWCPAPRSDSHSCSGDGWSCALFQCQSPAPLIPAVCPCLAGPVRSAPPLPPPRFLQYLFSSFALIRLLGLICR